jgi:arylsulfatase A-like enzyme
MGEQPGFQGVVAPDVASSVPWWPEPPMPAPGSPNVVVVLLDDAGFAHFGAFGAPAATPTIDRLAEHGLRFTNFTVAAVCSPTRAALLTGRNHHAVGMSFVANFDTGFPNMRGGLPRSAATMARVLRDQGYATFCIGKWHIAPGADCTAAGPFHHWPLQQGFDRYYGFLGGETDQFHPELVCDNHLVEPPRTPAEGYHLTEDLVDHAIGMVRDVTSLTPERPFLLYLAPGATHAPHHSPESYREKYRGAFDEGWDVWRERVFARQQQLGVVAPGTELPPRNDGVPAWDSLTENERRFAARLQEAHAAFLEHTDAQLGRLVDALEEMGLLDNTVLVVTTDNGASQEGGVRGVLDEMKYFQGIEEDPDRAVERLDDIGGPDSHPNYPWGWAMVGNTPFRRYKQNVHWGGVRAPFVFHWPARLGAGAAGGIRTQFHNAIDVLPTVLEACGATMPHVVDGVAQIPLHGTSMLYALDAADAPSRRRSQYFEMFGHRAMVHDRHKAVTWHRPGTSFDDDVWELYDVVEDPTECHDLAAERPEVLADLVARWWVDAGRYDVLPMDDRLPHQMARVAWPGQVTARTRYVYRPPVSHLPVEACPPHGPRAFRIEADVTVRDGDEGVLVNRGTQNGGYALYVLGGVLHFDYNCFHDHSHVVAAVPVPAGRVSLGVHVVPAEGGAGIATVSVDGAPCGEARIPMPSRTLSSLGMDLGRCVSPVCADYERPFAFRGTIHSITFEVPDHSTRTPDEVTAEHRERLGLA